MPQALWFRFPAWVPSLLLAPQLTLKGRPSPFALISLPKYRSPCWKHLREASLQWRTGERGGWHPAASHHWGNLPVLPCPQSLLLPELGTWPPKPGRLRSLVAWEDTARSQWKGNNTPVFRCLPQGLKLRGWFAAAQKMPAAWPHMCVAKKEIIRDTC